MALHVHFKILSDVLCKTTTWNHYILRIWDNASPHGKFFMYLFEIEACLDTVRQTEYIQPFAKFVREMQVQFLIDVFLGVAVVVA